MKGTSRWGESSARIASTSITAATSSSSRRWNPANPAVVQVSSAGATTRTPDASPRIHVRTTSHNSPASITPPSRRASGPIAPLTTEAKMAQATSARTSATRAKGGAGGGRERVGTGSQVAAPAGQPAQGDRGQDERQRVPHRLREHGGEGRREVPEQQVADDDARPQPDPAEEQHGQTQPRRRPERRDRAVEVSELQADLAGQVVRGGETSDGGYVQPGTAAPSPAQPRDPSAQVDTACSRPGYRHRPHDLPPTLFLSAGEVTGA